MPIVAGEPTHITQVRVYDGVVIGKDQPVRYAGPPNWKFRPLDPVAAAKWEVEIADPARELQANLATKDILRLPMSAAEKAREQAIHAQRRNPVRLEY
jgi:hypothetical protein